jgi:hypothetical protein
MHPKSGLVWFLSRAAFPVVFFTALSFAQSKDDRSMASPKPLGQRFPVVAYICSWIAVYRPGGAVALSRADPSNLGGLYPAQSPAGRAIGWLCGSPAGSTS